MTSNTESRATPVPARPRDADQAAHYRLDARRRLIAGFIAERGGRLPTLRAVQSLLKKVGCCVSRTTVHGDLKFLGLLSGWPITG